MVAPGWAVPKQSTVEARSPRVAPVAEERALARTVVSLSLVEAVTAPSARESGCAIRSRKHASTPPVGPARNLVRWVHRICRASGGSDLGNAEACRRIRARRRGHHLPRAEQSHPLQSGRKNPEQRNTEFFQTG